MTIVTHITAPYSILSLFLIIFSDIYFDIFISSFYCSYFVPYIFFSIPLLYFFNSLLIGYFYIKDSHIKHFTTCHTVHDCLCDKLNLNWNLLIENEMKWMPKIEHYRASMLPHPAYISAYFSAKTERINTNTCSWVHFELTLNCTLW